jgi:uroporphyrinogen decarboxylase
MHFKPVDYIPDEEFGYWSENLAVWKQQGVPDNVTNLEAYFQFAPRSGVPAGLGFSYGFESKVVEETDKYRIIQDGDGAKQQVFTDGSSTIPHYIEFGLKGRKEWEELYKPRLDIDNPSRYPENRSDWEQIKARFNDPNWSIPIGIGMSSLFGVIRNWAGFEGISMLCYDDPELVEEMITHLADMTCAVIKRAASEIKIDYAAGWEDMAFNHGPIISPTMIRKWLTPNYKRISDILRANGCDIIYTDCDGNINDMIEPWLEGGVNGIFPVDVVGGTEPIAIRKKYGNKVVMLGGVDKHALIAGKDAIKAYIKKIKPYVLEGGWIPHVDHRCPPDVTFENYLYYLDVKRETFGMPKDEEFENRPEVKKIKSTWKETSLAV